MMRMRWTLFGLVLATILIMTAAASVPATAQGAKKVIKISMVSWKFIPDQIAASQGDTPIIEVSRGDTVIFQVSNDDPARRPHNIAARWLTNMQVDARGQFRTGTDDERRFFAAQVGEKFELEMAFSQAGSFPFVCGIFDHGARGMVAVVNVSAARR